MANEKKYTGEFIENIKVSALKIGDIVRVNRSDFKISGLSFGPTRRTSAKRHICGTFVSTDRPVASSVGDRGLSSAKLDIWRELSENITRLVINPT